MIFNYRYSGSSAVEQSSQSVDVSFSPDTYREPTFFRGSLNKHIPFREAISALHDVVVSDLRFKPKDKTEYKRWAIEQEETLLGEAMGKADILKSKIDPLREELSSIRSQKSRTLKPFYEAQRHYFNYLYKKDRDAWYVLDPVITIHPDELFFECFSEDESSYAKLSCNYNVFNELNEFKCGTTNIDYSANLYNEFQKIRDYKETLFKIDPSGFDLKTSHEESYKEVKIDLPDSWVRGFLQVSSAMSLASTTIELNPMDIYNFCSVLRRHKEKEGPRSMKYLIRPGQPLKVVFEPWNIEVNCPKTICQSAIEQEVRVWGRRRILLLERLIPLAKSFKLHLLGSGLPSFYIADLGDMSFTLGLSGWTANDWSRLGNFDLMAPRLNVDSLTQQKIYTGLKENWHESANSLANRLGFDRKVVLGALSAYTQAGRVIYDMNNNEYRIRELSRETLAIESLRFSNEREAQAHHLVEQDGVKINTHNREETKQSLQGNVREKNLDLSVQIEIDGDEKLVEGHCICNFFKMNQFNKGPCSHMLALRIKGRQY